MKPAVDSMEMVSAIFIYLSMASEIRSRNYPRSAKSGFIQLPKQRRNHPENKKTPKPDTERDKKKNERKTFSLPLLSSAQ